MNLCKRLLTFSLSRSWHSQTMRTRKPRALNWWHLVASRRLLSCNFCFQKRFLDFGTREPAPPFVLGQFLWPCQKHPFTKIAHRRVRFARSADPGRSRFRIRYRIPRAATSLRTSSSALVFACLTAFIMRDRVAGETMSIGCTKAIILGHVNEAGGYRESSQASSSRRLAATTERKPSGPTRV